MDGELVHFTPSPAGASPRVASCSTQTPGPTSPPPLCQAQAGSPVRFTLWEGPWFVPSSFQT